MNQRLILLSRAFIPNTKPAVKDTADSALSCPHLRFVSPLSPVLAGPTKNAKPTMREKAPPENPSGAYVCQKIDSQTIMLGGRSTR